MIVDTSSPTHRSRAPGGSRGHEARVAESRVDSAMLLLHDRPAPARRDPAPQRRAVVCDALHPGFGRVGGHAPPHFFAQVVELTHLIPLENLRHCFNLALGVGAAGFSQGMLCAAPACVEPDQS
jgi:hypothetical protein